MPYDELLKWIKFFSERPQGWQEDQRTFLLLKAQGYKGKPEDLFPSLKIIKTMEDKRNREHSGRALPKGLFLDKMLKAVNGDDSGWKPAWGEKNAERNGKS